MQNHHNTTRGAGYLLKMIKPYKKTNAFVLIIVSFYLFCPPAFSECYNSAGKRYNVPPELLKAVAWRESNFNPDAIHKNKNGSIDYGLMQINSWWIKKIGEERWKYLSNPCYNVNMGAWILSDCVDRYGFNWDALSCYRSGKPLKKLGEETRLDVIGYIEDIVKYMNRDN